MATPGWVLRPVRPDRAFHMEGRCLEAHVAAASRAERGENQDLAVDAAGELQLRVALPIPIV